jgi:septation ring formation regulator EzrA
MYPKRISGPAGPDKVDAMEAQIGRLESDVAHIQSDVTDIKADLRRANDRIDKLHEKVEVHAIESMQRDNVLSTAIDSLRHEMKQGFASLKIWALLLYAGLAGGLLAVMARGFKWI